MELSRKDLRLLFELDQNSRQSNLSLARKLRISKNTVSASIDKLKKADVIGGFYAVIDVGKLGYRGIRVYLKLRQCPPKKREQILSYLVKSKRVWWVGNIDGDYDVGIVIWVKEPVEFEEFWAGFSSKFHKHIAGECVCVYTGLYDGTFGFLEPTRERKVYHVGGYSKTETTQNELAVLGEISGNARVRTVDIAAKLGLSPLTVKGCVKKLYEKGVIRGFRVKLDLSALGYSIYKMNFRIANLGSKKKMLVYALEKPNVIFIDESIGFADLEVSIACKTHLKFREFLDEFNGKFSREILGYSYFTYLKVHKIKHV
ncbi:MAG: winged helix-turn-helix transcriptional regulator [Candidatus Micrarchaeota archaeon]